MDAARRLVALGRAARTDAKVKARQPLRRALLLHPGVTLGEEVRAEIADELNVKALEDIDELRRPGALDGRAQLPGPRAPPRARR